MSVISLRNVSKSFGVIDAIQDLSLTIGEGEFVVLLGPTGLFSKWSMRRIRATSSTRRAISRRFTPCTRRGKEIFLRTFICG